MQSIVDYFNAFTQVIFGLNLLITPRQLFDWYNTIFTQWTASGSDFSWFVGKFIQYPDKIFSSIVWFWFLWLTFYLLILCPFKWFRSLVKRK